MAVHYRPVYILWQMLNEQIFGAVLPWWHVTSLLLHLGVIFLVYQVGLKLVPTKGPVEVLVIDHVELPSEN